MRRWYPAAVRDHYIIATPDMVQVSTGVARNFTQNIHIGRSFNMEDVAKGGVPRLGAAVPRQWTALEKYASLIQASAASVARVQIGGATQTGFLIGRDTLATFWTEGSGAASSPM